MVFLQKVLHRYCCKRLIFVLILLSKERCGFMEKNLAKTEFIDLYKTYIKRDGADKLLDYLTNNGFFSAPASAKYHLAVEGGLCEHSLNVYKRLVAVVKQDYGEDYAKYFSDETLAICGLLHDVCKVNYYGVEYRNTKEDGVWVQKPYYKVEEKFPYGHGEKSVFHNLSNSLRKKPFPSTGIWAVLTSVSRVAVTH